MATSLSTLMLKPLLC